MPYGHRALFWWAASSFLRSQASSTIAKVGGKLLLLTGWNCASRLLRQRWRGGFGRGCGTSKSCSVRAVSSPNLGTFDRSYKLAPHRGLWLGLRLRLGGFRRWALSECVRRNADHDWNQERSHCPFPFAFSPSSITIAIIARKASGLVIAVDCLPIHLSSAARSDGGMRTIMPVEPTAGRPGGRFRVSETIDLAMGIRYQKKRAGARLLPFRRL